MKVGEPGRNDHGKARPKAEAVRLIFSGEPNERRSDYRIMPTIALEIHLTEGGDGLAVLGAAGNWADA